MGQSVESNKRVGRKNRRRGGGERKGLFGGGGGGGRGGGGGGGEKRTICKRDPILPLNLQYCDLYLLAGGRVIRDPRLIDGKSGDSNLVTRAP